MTTATDAIALFRSYIGVWTYGLGVHDDKDKVSDCMYMVDVWAQTLGIADKLGPVLPWNVSYFVAHTSFPHTGPTGEIHKGDILVLGDPKATDLRLKYAHIGVATDPGKYISQYNYGINVTERAINRTATMQPVLVFWTGFDQTAPTPPAPEADMIPTKPFGSLDVTTNPNARGVDLNTGALVDGVAGKTFPVLFETTLVTPISPDPDSVHVYAVAVGTRLVGILARNVIFTPTVEPAPVAHPFTSTLSVSGTVNADGSVTFTRS